MLAAEFGDADNVRPARVADRLSDIAGELGDGIARRDWAAVTQAHSRLCRIRVACDAADNAWMAEFVNEEKAR